jgi:hypothetical protein
LILDSFNVLFCFAQENGLGWAPVLLDYFDKDAGSTELRVTFEDCLFDQNEFTGEPGQDALVVGNSQQNRLVFEKCQFTNNDVVINNRDVSIALLFGYSFCGLCRAACCSFKFS